MLLSGGASDTKVNNGFIVICSSEKGSNVCTGMFTFRVPSNGWLLKELLYARTSMASLTSYPAASHKSRSRLASLSFANT